MTLFHQKQLDYYLARIKALTPTEEDASDYLRECLDIQIETVSTEIPMGVVSPSMFSATQIYASARTTVENLDSPEQIANRPEGIVDLGTIEWLLRPALPIQNGFIEPPITPPWNKLASNIVEKASQAVCRLDLVYEGYEPLHLGTGFIVKKSNDGVLSIMTNAHVVQAAIHLGWTKTEGLEFGCNYEKYSHDNVGNIFFLMKEYRIHPRYDLALVFLNQENHTAPLPESILSVTATTPNPIERLEIGVIGHPSFDAAKDPFPKYFGFGDAFGIKRLSPGLIRVMEKRVWLNNEIDLFLHDATTLSGSSGSCIIDLNSKRVIGLHFGGWLTSKRTIETDSKDMLAELFEANGAVPLWLLANDPILKQDVFFE